MKIKSALVFFLGLASGSFFGLTAMLPVYNPEVRFGCALGGNGQTYPDFLSLKF